MDDRQLVLGGRGNSLWEFNRLVDDLFRRWGVDLTPFGVLSNDVGVYTPRVDVEESDQEIRISAELPGLTEKDVEVSLSDGMLIIRGEKSVEREERSKNSYH